MVHLFYDGSFEGFMTTIHSIRALNLVEVKILPNTKIQTTLFANTIIVETNRDKAKAIWNQIEQKGPFLSKLIYFSFLSEEEGIENRLFEFISCDFNSKSENCISNRNYLESLYKKISLEKKQLEYVTRFKSSDMGFEYAILSPVYNTLPLLTREFKLKFGKEYWIIADQKRNYGIACKNGELQIIQNPGFLFSKEIGNFSVNFDNKGSGRFKSIESTARAPENIKNLSVYASLKNAV
jgi:probable DNA metabolism protein